MENSFRIASAAVSDRGLSDKRPQNEDSYLEMPKSGIFAVADGVGGAQAGEVASQMAVEILGEAFANFAANADAEEVMRTALGRANSAIHQMSRELPQLANMASTIVAIYLDGDVATVAHVGDSRAYSVNAEGVLHRLTDDHSMVAEEVRAGRMTEEQAENHPNKSIISRALGAEPTVDVEIKTLMFEPGTAFLICSDGITRHVGDAEIKGVLTFGGDPTDICEYLRGLCYERGAEDNLTAVVIKTARAGAASAASSPRLDHEEPTIAAARSPFDAKARTDNELFELNPEAAPPRAAETTVESSHSNVERATDSFTMFGDTGDGSAEPETDTGGIGRIATIAVSLLIGALLGMGAYYLFLAPKPSETITQPLTEMRAANIPLSAFEENRRSVDKDPAAYLHKYPQPQDAEDFYLVGRAFLLTGDFTKARAAFTAARDRLSEADSTNVNVVRNDIAIMMAVTNDTTIQTILRKEIQPPSAANSNTQAANSNR